MTPEIEWHERGPEHERLGYDGKIGDLRIASVVTNQTAQGWWIHMYLAPLTTLWQEQISGSHPSQKEAKHLVEQILFEFDDALHKERMT